MKIGDTVDIVLTKNGEVAFNGHFLVRDNEHLADIDRNVCDHVCPDNAPHRVAPVTLQPAGDAELLERMPKIPDDLSSLPAWWSDDVDAPGLDALNHSKVARLVGEFGLAVLQASNAQDGRRDDWPVGDWDGLANSSKWSCVRVGLKALRTAQESAAARREVE